MSSFFSKEDNIADSSSYKRQTEKTKKGLGSYLRCVSRNTKIEIVIIIVIGGAILLGSAGVQQYTSAVLILFILYVNVHYCQCIINIHTTENLCSVLL